MDPKPNPDPNPNPNPNQVGGSAPGEMDEPSDLAVHKGEVFVADTRSSRLKLVARAAAGLATHGSRRPRAVRAAALWAPEQRCRRLRPVA